MRELRHCGEFADEDSTTIRWEIWQEPPFGSSDPDVRVPYSENIRLEWESTDLTEALCPSAATLTIISATDREFADLYTADPTAVELRVYKAGGLWWRGFLDPEFYEEPYGEEKGYDVSLTFTDMGAMGRAKFALTGLCSLRRVLAHALEAIDADAAEVDTTAVSTISYNGQSILTLGIDAANFYDETGEPMSRSEALEAALAPLGLRLVQKQGVWHLYDLNGAATRPAADQVRWLTADTLSAAPTYSTLEAAWSTYALASLGDDPAPWGDTPPTPDDRINLYHQAPKEENGAQYWSYPYNAADIESGYPDPEYTLWIKESIEGATLCNSALRCFKVVQQLGGDDCQGVAVAWPAFDILKKPMLYGLDTTTLGDWYTPKEYRMSAADKAAAKPLFKTDPISIPPPSADSLRLRITMPIIVDRAYNCFEEYHEDHSDNHLTRGSGTIKRLFVPVGLYLRGHSGKLYAWGISGYMNGQTTETIYGKWYELDSADDRAPGRGYFDYRDEKKGEKAPLYDGKWVDNQPTFRVDTDDYRYKRRGIKAGQECAYPPEGGDLWLEVYDRGWLQKGYKMLWNSSGIEKLSPWWLLFKLPTIEIIKASGYDTDIDTDDRQYSYTINPQAKDELSLDFSCGMDSDDVPAARGAYLDPSTGRQVHTLTRAGRRGTCFDLLAGTMFSQYAARHTILTGTALTPPWGTLTDLAQDPALRFLPTEEAQDLRAGTSELTLTEISPDDYDLEDIQQND